MTTTCACQVCACGGASATALTFCGLSIAYGDTMAVERLTASFPAGSFVGVCGPNGAGKSTLLAGLMGWLPWASGTALLDGVACCAATGRVAYLPQRRPADLDVPITVAALVAMGRCASLGAFRGFAAADRAAVASAMEQMGVTALADRPLAGLSGGQFQRVLVARALASGADVLLLDEPLAGLDAPSAEDLLARLAAWAAAGRLAVAVIHDLAAIRRHCTQVLLMNRRLIACGPPDVALAEAHLVEAYGQAVAS